LAKEVTVARAASELLVRPASSAKAKAQWGSGIFAFSLPNSVQFILQKEFTSWRSPAD